MFALGFLFVMDRVESLYSGNTLALVFFATVQVHLILGIYMLEHFIYEDMGDSVKYSNTMQGFLSNLPTYGAFLTAFPVALLVQMYQQSKVPLRADDYAWLTNTPFIWRVYDYSFLKDNSA